MIRKLKRRYLLFVVAGGFIVSAIGTAMDGWTGGLWWTIIRDGTICLMCFSTWMIDCAYETTKDRAERWEKLYRQQQQLAGTREVYYSTLDDLLHATTDALGTFNAQQATAAASRGGDE